MNIPHKNNRLPLFLYSHVRPPEQKVGERGYEEHNTHESPERERPFR